MRYKHKYSASGIGSKALIEHEKQTSKYFQLLLSKALESLADIVIKESVYVAVCLEDGSLVTYTIWQESNNGFPAIYRIQSDSLSWDMQSTIFHKFYETIGKL